MKIIKRDGHEQEFKKEKIYSSIYESCLNAHHDKKTAENIARKATNDVIKNLKGKSTVKAENIFKII